MNQKMINEHSTQISNQNEESINNINTNNNNNEQSSEEIITLNKNFSKQLQLHRKISKKKKNK